MMCTFIAHDSINLNAQLYIIINEAKTGIYLFSLKKKTYLPDFRPERTTGVYWSSACALIRKPDLGSTQCFTW